MKKKKKKIAFERQIAPAAQAAVAAANSTTTMKIISYVDLTERPGEVLDSITRFLFGESRFEAPRPRSKTRVVHGRSSLSVERRFANWPQIKRWLDKLYARLCLIDESPPSCCQHWLEELRV
jgi:hypothetical protein